MNALHYIAGFIDRLVGNRRPPPRPRTTNVRHFFRFAPGEPWEEWPVEFDASPDDLFEGEAMAIVEVRE